MARVSDQVVTGSVSMSPCTSLASCHYIEDQLLKLSAIARELNNPLVVQTLNQEPWLRPVLEETLRITNRLAPMTHDGGEK